MDIANLGIVLLAAGASSRMGQSKQLLPVENEPLLLRTAHTALQSHIKNIVVVLGAKHEAHHTVIARLPLKIVINQHWQKGMGTSIKAGLAELLRHQPQLQGVIFLVCDQPLLSVGHIKALAEKYTSGKGIIASAYAGTIGVPVLFIKTFFQKLNALEGEHGAKKLITENPLDVLALDFPGGEIDLDTMNDYNAFERKITRQKHSDSH